MISVMLAILFSVHLSHPNLVSCAFSVNPIFHILTHRIKIKTGPIQGVGLIGLVPATLFAARSHAYHQSHCASSAT